MRSTRMPKALCRSPPNGSADPCCLAESGAARRRRRPDRFAEGARVRVSGRARRLRRRVAFGYSFRDPTATAPRGSRILDLHHFYRAMAWLGEELEERPDGALAPRCVKDLI